jgi:hypothetical protein
VFLRTERSDIIVTEKDNLVQQCCKVKPSNVQCVNNVVMVIIVWHANALRLCVGNPLVMRARRRC